MMKDFIDNYFSPVQFKKEQYSINSGRRSDWNGTRSSMYRKYHALNSIEKTEAINKRWGWDGVYKSQISAGINHEMY